VANRDRPSMLMRVKPHGLVPAGPWDAELYAELKTDAVVKVEVKQARSNPLNAKYWAILGRVVENTHWPSARALNKALLMEANHIERVRLMNGEMLAEPRSLSDLEGPEFEAFYDWAIQFICTEVLPGTDPKALEEMRR